MIAALVVALAFAFAYFTAKKECSGGAFSAGVSSGFDIKRCDLVIRKNGDEIVFQVRLPQ